MATSMLERKGYKKVGQEEGYSREAVGRTAMTKKISLLKNEGYDVVKVKTTRPRRTQLYAKKFKSPKEEFKAAKKQHYKPGNLGFSFNMPGLYTAQKTKKGGTKHGLAPAIKKEASKTPKVVYDKANKVWKFIKPKKGFYD